MDFSIWSIANAFTKLLIYAGISGVVGGTCIYFLKNTNDALKSSVERYLFKSAYVGIVAVLINFFIQVGAFAENGFLGMFDRSLYGLLWQTGTGDAVLLRIVGLSLPLLIKPAIELLKWFEISFKNYLVASFLYIPSIVLLGLSFSRVGHTTELDEIYKVFIAIHIIGVSWWMGLLWPLYKACAVLSQKDLQKLMYGFGHLAQWAVFTIVLCGVSLILGLVKNPWDALQSSYGMVMLVKLLLVVALLMLAAIHKFRLVPALEVSNDAASRLSLSIRIELIIGIVVLATTSILTTVVGPLH